MASSDAAVDTVRGFNRFYTRQIGLLQEGLLKSPFSLAEARILFELARRDEGTASDLGRALDMDAGYLSRLLRSLEMRGLLERHPSSSDARQSWIRLTTEGAAAFASLDDRSRQDVAAMLGTLSGAEQGRLLGAMAGIQSILGEGENEPFRLRPHAPGDLGWIVQRHGALYAREYGWDASIEALVARVAADFIESFDPARERCWIAERRDARIGSVMVVNGGEGAAKLRLLLVDPEARGLGLGRRLVAECLAFAREVGYARMTLWTNSVLIAARRLYEEAGFYLRAQEPHRSFGHDLVGETWERVL